MGQSQGKLREQSDGHSAPKKVAAERGPGAGVRSMDNQCGTECSEWDSSVRERIE